MTAKKYVVVVNPRGGTRRGLNVLDDVRPVFQSAEAELDVHVTTHAGHAAELARTADLSRCDGFCVIGGDGTIHEAVSGLMERTQPVSTPLGMIPGGTGNSVLQHLECLEPFEAAQRIVGGNTQPLDVVRVTMGDEVAYCINIIGWGAVVDINRTAERLRWLGPPRYAIAALIQILRARRRRARLILDGQAIDDEFLLVAACNTKYTGKGMLLAPEAKMDDGKLDVVFVRRASRRQMLQLFNKVFDGSHMSLPCMDYQTVSSFSIEPDDIDVLNLDGELEGSTPVSAEVIPSALQIFV